MITKKTKNKKGDYSGVEVETSKMSLVPDLGHHQTQKLNKENYRELT